MQYRIECTFTNGAGSRKEYHKQHGVVYSADTQQEAEFVAADIEKRHNSKPDKTSYCRARPVVYKR